MGDFTFSGPFQDAVTEDELPGDLATLTAGMTRLYKLDFDQDTESPATIVTPPEHRDAIISRVAIAVDVAAAVAGPTVQVGISTYTGATADRFLAATDADLSSVGTYIVDSNVTVGLHGFPVILTVTPAGQVFSGTAYVWLTPLWEELTIAEG